MNEQRRGDELLRTFNAGFNGSGTQETIGGISRLRPVVVLPVTRMAHQCASKVHWGSSVKMRVERSGVEMRTGRADSNRNTAFQGSLERATEVDDRKIQEQQCKWSIAGVSCTEYLVATSKRSSDSGFTRRMERGMPGSRIYLDLTSILL